MIREFRTATIIPFRLIPFVEGILAEKKYKPPAAVRDFLSRLQTPSPEEEIFLYEAACHIIDIAQLLEKYAEDEFHYRREKVYPSMYYLTIAGGYIKQEEAHFELPDDYADLAKNYTMILENQEKLDHPAININASFCYRVETLYLLNGFLKELRTGERLLEDPDTAEAYDKVVRLARPLAGNEDQLAIDICQSIQKINFIMNHHDNPLCSYIVTSPNTGNELSTESLFAQLPEQKTENTEKIFHAACATLAALHENSDYDFYNDFSEKIIAPIHLLYLVHRDIDPACIDYMIAHCALAASDNPEKFMSEFDPGMTALYQSANSTRPAYDVFASHGITQKDLVSMSACIEISDFIYKTLHIGGPNVSPLYDGDEIVYLYEKLNDTKDYEINNSHLAMMWQACRANALEHITEFFNQYPDAPRELGLQPIPG